MGGKNAGNSSSENGQYSEHEVVARHCHSQYEPHDVWSKSRNLNLMKILKQYRMSGQKNTSFLTQLS